MWKLVLIVAVLVIFGVAIIPGVLSKEPIRRGLDLKGGTHLVMRVNVGDAVRLETDQASEMLKAQAKKGNLPIPVTKRVNDTTFIATLPADTPVSGYETIAKDYIPSFDVGRTPE